MWSAVQRYSFNCSWTAVAPVAATLPIPTASCRTICKPAAFNPEHLPLHITATTPATPEVPAQQLLQPVDSPVDVQLPIAPRNPRFAELLPSDINRAKLKNIHDVLQKYSTWRVESKIGILAVKLAREFSNDILKRCTPRGWNDMPALPQMELNHLKAACCVWAIFTLLVLPRTIWKTLGNCSGVTGSSMQKAEKATTDITA